MENTTRKTLWKTLSTRTGHSLRFHGNITDQELKKLHLDPALTEQIYDSLSSKNEGDIITGLWAVAGIFTPEYPESPARDPFVKLVHQLCTSASGYVRAKAIKTLRVFNNEIKGYRALMLSALQDPHPAVRWEALHAYPTYAKDKETAPLDAFEKDPYQIEIGTMSGPYRYLLRELAQEIRGRMKD